MNKIFIGIISTLSTTIIGLIVALVINFTSVEINTTDMLFELYEHTAEYGYEQSYTKFKEDVDNKDIQYRVLDYSVQYTIDELSWVSIYTVNFEVPTWYTDFQKGNLVNYNVYYSVSFDSSTEQLIDTQIIQKGYKAIEPKSPSLLNYEFNGWNYNEELFDFSTPITKTKKLNATWNYGDSDIYTVTLDVNGGDSLSNDTLEYLTGSTVTLPVPTKSGYIFDGWYDNNLKYESGLWEYNKNIALTAKWISNTSGSGGSGEAGKVYYTVTYDTNGGSLSTTSNQYAYGDYAVHPKPTKTGYVFDGWFNGNSVVYDGVWDIQNNITLVAKYSDPSSTITYDVNGGNQLQTSTQKTNYGEVTTLLLPSRDGYIFTGWTYHDTLVSNGVWKYKGNITLVAGWMEVAVEEVEAYYEINDVVYKYDSTTDSYSLYKNSSFQTTLIVLDTIKGKPVTSIEANASEGNTTLQHLIVGNFVEVIGDSAFYGCKALETVKLGTNVLRVEEDAFDTCNSMREVILNDKLVFIGRWAFAYNTNLKTVKIPASVTTVSYQAFGDCTSLISVFIDNNVGKISLSSSFSQASIYYNDSEFFDWKLEENNIVYYYIEETDSYGVDRYIGEDSVVIIPETFNGKDVTVIGEAAFKDKLSINQVVLNNNITTILDNAFSGSFNIEEITLSSNLETISSYAFANCHALKNIDIISNVTSIGDYAFYKCTTIQNIELPNTVETLGEYVFAYCTSLTNITLPVTLSEISNYAFYYCTSLTNIDLPVSLEIIGDYAFYTCSSLESITFPESLTIIGEQAFYGCKQITTLVLTENIITIKSRAFSYLSITELVIPENIVSFGTQVFGYCDMLTDVTINSKTTSGYMFYYCKNLTNVTFSENTTTINYSTFNGCYSLYTIFIPNTITSISYDVFKYCYKLVYIYCEGSVGSFTQGSEWYYNSTVIYDVTDINSIEFKDDNFIYLYNSTTETYSIKSYIGNSEIVMIPSEFNGKPVTKIEASLLYLDTFTKIIYIPSSITSVGEKAFYSHSINLIVSEGSSSSFTKGTDWYRYATLSYNCTSFDDLVKVVDEVIYLFDNTTYTFKVISYVSGSVNYEIKEDIDRYKVVSIESRAFYLCEAQSIIISENIESIKDQAFYDCKNLLTITLPDKVTEISLATFYRCSSLKSVVFGSDTTKIGEDAFYECISLQRIDLPNTVTSLGESAFEKCSSLSIVNLSTSLKTIGNMAFDLCISLKTIYIPASVTSVGYSVFDDCHRLNLIVCESTFSATNSTWYNGVTVLRYSSTDPYSTIIIDDVIYSYNKDTSTYYVAAYIGTDENVVIKDMINGRVVDTIVQNAFEGSTTIKSVTIPNSIKTIGENAFSNCTSLNEINYLGSSFDLIAGANWNNGVKVNYL